MRPTATLRTVKALVEANAAHNVYTNGISAVNLPASTSAAQIAISLKAGSANETAANPGAATFTRYCLGLSNYRNTGLLQQRMVNLMGGKFETFGNRERTTITITAGPKAIEELAMDVLIPSIQSPMFFKYELFFPWDQAKRAAKCPFDEAFHQATFSGGLSNKLGFYGGYGSETPRMLEERDEILEEVARDFHHNHYGTEDSIVVGSGVPESLLEKVVLALEATPFANRAGAPSKFQAGQVRIMQKGNSRAVVGVDVTGADQAAAAVVAASLGGKVISYSNVQVIQFAVGSEAQLSAALAGLSNINVADAQANAALQQAIVLSSGSSAAVKAVANAVPIVDAAGADSDSIVALAQSVLNAPKSMVVIGDVHAFPQNTDI